MPVWQRKEGKTVKLTQLKINAIIENQDHKVIQIPADGIRFVYKGHVIQNNDPIEIMVMHDGSYQNVVRDINAFAYINLSNHVIGRIMKMNLFSIVAHQDMQLAIYKEIVKQCKVVPLHKPIDERRLFEKEYGAACAQLMGV